MGHPGESATPDGPVVVVDAAGRGDFVSLASAVSAAAPGTRVVVRPGEYHGPILLDKELDIVGGEGVRDSIVVSAVGEHVVVFTADEGRVAKLTLRQKGGGGGCGVDIRRGRLELVECDISSESLACVAIHGDATPVVRGNRIHDGKSAGVYIYEQGAGVFQDNDIHGNTLAGVEVADGANPVVRGGRIHDNGAAGVLILARGAGVFQDNDIHGNTLAGVEVADGANPVMRWPHPRQRGRRRARPPGWGRGVPGQRHLRKHPRRRGRRNRGRPRGTGNRVHNHKGAGLHVTNQGEGVFQDNDIHANYAGVEVSMGGSPEVLGNRIHNNRAAGVHVHQDGAGVFQDNDIHSNALAGVDVWTQGAGVFQDNDIHNNSRAGVEVREEGAPEVRANRIHDNGSSGVWVHAQGAGVFQDNDIYGNTLCR